MDFSLQSSPTKKLPKKKRNRNSRCVTLYTKWNISGWKDNELKYFERHLVKCPKNRLLKFVKLQIDKKLTHEPSKKTEVTRMRFKYSCCRARVYSCKWFATKPVKSGNAYRLNSIVPKCKCNKVLKAFRFVTKFQQPGYKNPQSYVKYQCCSFHYRRLNTYEKKKMSTPWNDSGNGRTKFLSRHNIRCEKRSFISSFRLALQDKNVKTNPSTRFDYTCIHPIYKKAKSINKRRMTKKPSMKLMNKQGKPSSGPISPKGYAPPPPTQNASGSTVTRNMAPPSGLPQSRGSMPTQGSGPIPPQSGVSMPTQGSGPIPPQSGRSMPSQGSGPIPPQSGRSMPSQRKASMPSGSSVPNQGPKMN